MLEPEQGQRPSTLPPLAEPLVADDMRAVVHGGDTWRTSSREAASIDLALADGQSLAISHPDAVTRHVYASITWPGGAAPATIVLPDLADIPGSTAYAIFGRVPATAAGGLRVSALLSGVQTNILTLPDGPSRDVFLLLVASAASDAWHNATP